MQHKLSSHTKTPFLLKKKACHHPEQMKPENALPAYLYCKLESTFQPGRKRQGGRHLQKKTEERVEKPALGRAAQKHLQLKTTSELQVKQT